MMCQPGDNKLVGVKAFSPHGDDARSPEADCPLGRAADYQRVCHVALPHTPAVPLVRPESMDPLLADCYRAQVGDVRHFGGFWRAGLELADAARRYRRACVSASRAADARTSALD